MGIAQLAERLVVVQEVAGSTPVTHPMGMAVCAGYSAKAALDIIQSGLCYVGGSWQVSSDGPNGFVP